MRRSLRNNKAFPLCLAVIERRWSPSENYGSSVPEEYNQTSALSGCIPIALCNLFSYTMDQLVREDICINEDACSDIRIEEVPAFSLCQISRHQRGARR